MQKKVYSLWEKWMIVQCRIVQHQTVGKLSQMLLFALECYAKTMLTEYDDDIYQQKVV